VILTISSIGPNAGDLSFLFHMDEEEAGDELPEDNRGPNTLHAQRLESVADVLKARGSARILDLVGCVDHH
jgi:hypothetical protein